MRVATIAIGITDYADPNLSASTSRLHFTHSDATAFHRYASTAWSDDDCIHLCLKDREAERSGVENAFHSLATEGSFDLFLLYLSGHGEWLEGTGWFCLADAISGTPSLTRVEIDALLVAVDARQVLVIADHCYAEASFVGSGFFSHLGGSTARIFIASARQGQKAWEDSDLKRSILSDLLLKAMVSGSPLSGRDGSVDVETKLVPYLREQVPLETAIRKNGIVQEPVTGGMATESVRLPTVASQDIRRSLSVTDALRSRLRRILVISFIVLLFSWISADLLVYHLAIATDGTVRVRPGPAALYALAPYHLGEEIDTGFTASDITTRDPDALRLLSRGAEFGFTTRRDADGLPPWLSQLSPALKSTVGSHASMLARAETPRLEEDEPPPVLETAFVSYATSRPAREIADLVYPAPAAVTVDCGVQVGGELDFTLLEVPSGAFARDLYWRALRIDDTHNDELAQLIKAVTYRQRLAKKDSEISHDTDILASALKLTSLGEIKLDDQPGWCGGPMLSMVRALHGDDVTRSRAEEAIATDLPSSEITPGAEILYPQMAAVAALNVLIKHQGVNDLTAEKVIRAFHISGDSLGSDTPLNQLVLQMSAHQRLPEPFRVRLFNTLEGRGEAQDFERLVAFRILARNSKYLGPDDVSKLRSWLDEHGESNRRSSQLHDGLGYFAQVTSLRPPEISWLIETLSPYSWLPPQTVSYRGEMVIQSSDQEAAVALSRVNRLSPLDQNDVLDRLITIAANRKDLQERNILLQGLDMPSSRYEEDLVSALSAEKTSALMRRLRSDIGVQHLVDLPRDERSRILSMLINSWKESRSAEMRMAIAEIIGRVRTLNPIFN